MMNEERGGGKLHKNYFFIAVRPQIGKKTKTFLLLCLYIIFSTAKNVRDNWSMWIKNITKHKLFLEFYKSNMTDLQMLGNSFFEFAWYRRTKDLIMLIDPKVHLFENSLLKVLAQLHSPKLRKVGTTLKLFFATQPFIFSIAVIPWLQFPIFPSTGHWSFP